MLELEKKGDLVGKWDLSKVQIFLARLRVLISDKVVLPQTTHGNFMITSACYWLLIQ